MTNPIAPTSAPTQGAPVPPAVTNTVPFMRMFTEGKHEELCQSFLQVFDNSREMEFVNFDPLRHYNINAFLAAFFYIVSHPDFIIPPQYGNSFILINAHVSALAAHSAFRNTDPWLELLRHQANNFVKILCLYSARNTVSFDRKKIFDADPMSASLWYMQYAQGHRAGLANKQVQRLKKAA